MGSDCDAPSHEGRQRAARGVREDEAEMLRTGPCIRDGVTGWETAEDNLGSMIKRVHGSA